MATPLETSLPLGGNDTEEQIKRLVSAARANHDKMAQVRQWDRANRAYLGLLYSEVEMPDWKAKGVHPKIWEAMQRLTATLADRNPTFFPRPRGPEDKLLSECLVAATDYEWERQEMQSKYVVAIRTLLIYGNAFFYTGVYPELRDDDLFTRVLSPRSWWPDPAATSDDDLTYGVLNSHITKSELVRIVGKEMARRILSEVSPSVHGPVEQTREQTLGGPGGIVDHGTVDPFSGSSFNSSFKSVIGGAKFGSDSRLEMKEIWLKEEAEIELDDDFGSLVVTVPKGRRVYLIGDRYFPEFNEAMDQPNPFVHDQIPVIRMSCEELIGEYYGQGRVLPLIDSAEQLADIDNQILNCARLMLNPVWMVPVESGINHESFYQYPGMVLPYRNGAEPKAVPPPPLPDYVFRLRDIKQREFDDASGISDVSRGSFEGGLDDVSGKAVQKLQDPMFTQLRPIARNMGRGIGRWGFQTACNAIQSWDEEKWRRVLPEPLASMPDLPVLNPEFLQRVLDGEVLLPEIRMEEGSTLPSDRDRRASQAYNLYDRGAFGPPGSPGAAYEILKAVEYPNADEIAQSVAQFAQTQPAPMAAPPEGGGGVTDKALGGEPTAESEAAMMGGSDQEVPL